MKNVALSLTEMMGNAGKMEKRALSLRVGRGKGPDGGKNGKKGLILAGWSWKWPRMVVEMEKNGKKC